MNTRLLRKQIRAVHLSAEKWWTIATQGERDAGKYDCECCKQFHGGWWRSCEGCPIRQKTGHRGCNGTPYKPWLLHHNKAHPYEGIVRYVHCDKCSDIAMEFYDWLVDLEQELTLKLDLGEHS
jgi:hypothetical protein